MDIRNAILAAADWIEKNPKEFDFLQVQIPKDRGCGTPGCALGWIGSFAGLYVDFLKPGFINAHGVAYQFMGLGVDSNTAADEFYRRMDEVSPNGWRLYNADCAKALRLYADRWHPATNEFPTGAEVMKAILSKQSKELSDVA